MKEISLHLQCMSIQLKILHQMFILSLRLQFWNHLFILKCQQFKKIQQERINHLTHKTQVLIFQALTILQTIVQVLLLKKVQICFHILKQSSPSLSFLKRSYKYLTYLRWRKKKMTTDLNLFSWTTNQNRNERIVKSSHRLSKILYKQKLWQMPLEKRNSKLNQEEVPLKTMKVPKSMLVDELRRKF